MFTGCFFLADGVVSYSMPQGERRGAEIDLFDMTYDGSEVENYLRGGLGQLTDGQKGLDNFRFDANGFGKGKRLRPCPLMVTFSTPHHFTRITLMMRFCHCPVPGYEWVGWKNDTGHLRPLELTFEFDQVRNFTAAYFYANNMYTKDVQVFSGARIVFSIGGQFFNGEPILFSYMPDTMMETARNVTIRLNGRVGRFVKFQLNFAAKWMMISEVSFESCKWPSGLDLVAVSRQVKRTFLLDGDIFDL